MFQSSSWGKGKKAESCHIGSYCKGENHRPKCRGGQFPLSVSIERGKGGKRRFPSSVAGLGTRLSSPAELPQINMQSWRDRFASQQDFKAVHQESGRKQEGLKGEEEGEGHTRLGPDQMGNSPTPHPKLTHRFFMRCKTFQVASAVSVPRPRPELLGFKLGVLGLKRPQVKASSFKPSQPRWKQEGLILLGVNPVSWLLFFPQSA